MATINKGDVCFPHCLALALLVITKQISSLLLLPEECSYPLHLLKLQWQSWGFLPPFVIYTYWLKCFNGFIRQHFPIAALLCLCSRLSSNSNFITNLLQLFPRFLAEKGRWKHWSRVFHIPEKCRHWTAALKVAKRRVISAFWGINQLWYDLGSAALVWVKLDLIFTPPRESLSLLVG